MTSSLRVILNVGDEEGFISYAEKVIFEMQRLWRGLGFGQFGRNITLR